MKKLIQLFKGKLVQNAGWLIGAKIHQILINLVISMLMARSIWLVPQGKQRYAKFISA